MNCKREITSCVFCLKRCIIPLCSRCSTTAHQECTLKYIGTPQVHRGYTNGIICPICRTETKGSNRYPNTRTKWHTNEILHCDINQVNNDAYMSEHYFDIMIRHVIEHKNFLSTDYCFMIAIQQKLTEAILSFVDNSHKYCQYYRQIFGTNFEFGGYMCLTPI